LTGAALESGGLWFAGAAWVHPPALCRALATHPRITLRLNTAVNSLTHADAGMLAK
jgi:tRNA 5-methylaminomethyl-2-thiouridine biosynthesis bifunctional protein